MLKALLDKKWFAYDNDHKQKGIKIHISLCSTGIIIKETQHDGVKFNTINTVCQVNETEDKLDLYDNHIKYTINKKDNQYFFNKYNGIIYHFIVDFPINLVV